MPQLERVTFESPTEREIYKQIEQNGPQRLEDVRDAVSLPDEEVNSILDRLQERGYVVQSDGTVELALDLGGTDSHRTPDFEYTVRPAREEDFDELLDVVEKIAGKKTYVIAKELAAEMRYDGTVFRYNTVRSRVFFVATVDEEIIGWSHLDLPLVDNLRSTARLTVGARPSYRGYGVATVLLNRALGWAKSSGYRKVYNNVARTNMQAVSFLESRGWEQEGVREGHYTIGHKQVDEVMMAYSFD